MTPARTYYHAALRRADVYARLGARAARRGRLDAARLWFERAAHYTAAAVGHGRAFGVGEG